LHTHNEDKDVLQFPNPDRKGCILDDTTSFAPKEGLLSGSLFGQVAMQSAYVFL
jgi:hypothetical protein